MTWRNISRLFLRCSPRAFLGSKCLNIMRLHTPQSAILSAVIFNALIIIALIPLALARRALSAVGSGGIAAPQSVDLWRRRDHCALYRDQGYRCVLTYLRLV